MITGTVAVRRASRVRSSALRRSGQAPWRAPPRGFSMKPRNWLPPFHAPVLANHAKNVRRSSGVQPALRHRAAPRRRRSAGGSGGFAGAQELRAIAIIAPQAFGRSHDDLVFARGGHELQRLRDDARRPERDERAHSSRLKTSSAPDRRHRDARWFARALRLGMPLRAMVICRRERGRVAAPR